MGEFNVQTVIAADAEFNVWANGTSLTRSTLTHNGKTFSKFTGTKNVARAPNTLDDLTAEQQRAMLVTKYKNKGSFTVMLHLSEAQSLSEPQRIFNFIAKPTIACPDLQ